MKKFTEFLSAVITFILGSLFFPQQAAADVPPPMPVWDIARLTLIIVGIAIVVAVAVAAALMYLIRKRHR